LNGLNGLQESDAVALRKLFLYVKGNYFFIQRGAISICGEFAVTIIWHVGDLHVGDIIWHVVHQ